jgi:DNA-binding CsgD family transcriptional regulator
MAKPQYTTSIVLARIQNLQDKLSKHHSLSISLIDAQGEELTISSNQNPFCSLTQCKNGEGCRKNIGRLATQARERREMIHSSCPLGIHMAVAPLGSSLDAESFADIEYYLVLSEADRMPFTSLDSALNAHDRLAAEQDLFREAAALVSHSFDLIFGLCRLNEIQLQPKPPARAPDLDILTKKEREVLHLVSSGMSNQEIALQLVISERTVKTHISNILKKLQMNNRTKLALYEIQVLK